jgi:hypothetical protein
MERCASAGDVYAAPSRLLDAHLAGRGAAFRVANERNSSELFLARPIGPASENPGHLAHLSAQRRTRLGTVGATLSDFVIPPAAFGSGADGVQSMGVEYHTHERSMHAVALEEADGVTVGARLFARGTALSVRGNHLETRNEEGWSAWSGETTRRTVTSAVFIPVGPLALNGSTELGEVRHREGSGPLQSHRANVSWTGTSSRGWIGASHGRLSPGGITQHLEPAHHTCPDAPSWSWVGGSPSAGRPQAGR